MEGKDEMTINADGGDAKAGTDTIVLNFLPDFIPPEVGNVSAGVCSASIVITDNKAIDCGSSEVVVKNGNTGETIPPADYIRSCTGDGTTSGSIVITFKPGTPPTPYTFDVNAKDANGNESGITQRSELVICEEHETILALIPFLVKLVRR